MPHITVVYSKNHTCTPRGLFYVLVLFLSNNANNLSAAPTVTALTQRPSNPDGVSPAAPAPAPSRRIAVRATPTSNAARTAPAQAKIPSAKCRSRGFANPQRRAVRAPSRWRIRGAADRKGFNVAWARIVDRCIRRSMTRERH